MNPPEGTIIRRPVADNFPLPRLDNELWLVGGMTDALGQDKLDPVSQALSGKGYTLRRYDDVFGNISPEALAYSFPGNTPDLESVSRGCFVDAVCKELGICLTGQETLAIRYVGKTASPQGTASLFSGIKLSPSDETSLVNSLLEYSGTLEDISDSGIRFRKNIPEPSKNPTPDELFDEEMQRVAEETRQGLEKLIMSGYSLEIIEGWLKTIVRPSRLIVTEKFEILLPDYDNMVIEMRQLPKALFLFFLKHESGFAIYQMEDHRDEILSIYDRITNSSESETIEKRIDDLVAPDGKSFIEKCSAIKKAFTEKISDRIAWYYYIHGPQGYAKRISLDRRLVEWRVKI